jgi:hypothetical protein
MRKHRSSIPPTRLVWLAPLAYCLLAASQSPVKPIAPGFQRERVSLVLIDVVATDRQGHPLADLGPEEFILMVDGHQVPLESVDVQRIAGSRIAPQPEAEGAAAVMPPIRRFVFFLDALNSEHGLGPTVIPALGRFLKKGLPPGDQVMVAGLGREFKIYQEPTDDPSKYLAALDTAQADPQLFAGGGNETRTDFEAFG